MAQWCKSLEYDNIALTHAEDDLGGLAVWECLKLAQIAVKNDMETVTAEDIRRMIRVKIDRAQRLLPYAQEILEATLKVNGKLSKSSENLRKSSENLRKSSENLRKSTEISENLEKSKDSYPSNPCGSTRVNKERIDREKEKTNDKKTENALTHPGDAEMGESVIFENIVEEEPEPEPLRLVIVEELPLEQPKKLTGKTLWQSLGGKGFADFYEIYPKKQGLQESARIWKAQKLEKRSSEVIESLKSELAVNKNRERQYWLDPERWLKRGRWLDEHTPDQTLSTISKPANRIQTVIDWLKQGGMVQTIYGGRPIRLTEMVWNRPDWTKGAETPQIYSVKTPDGQEHLLNHLKIYNPTGDKAATHVTA